MAPCVLCGQLIPAQHSACGMILLCGVMHGSGVHSCAAAVSLIVLYVCWLNGSAQFVLFAACSIWHCLASLELPHCRASSSGLSLSCAKALLQVHTCSALCHYGASQLLLECLMGTTHGLLCLAGVFHGLGVCGACLKGLIKYA
jgi:hypothetical protein